MAIYCRVNVAKVLIAKARENCAQIIVAQLSTRTIHAHRTKSCARMRNSNEIATNISTRTSSRRYDDEFRGCASLTTKQCEFAYARHLARKLTPCCLRPCRARPVPRQAVRSARGTASTIHSQVRLRAQNATDAGSPPCSPQIPSFNFGRILRPRSVAIRINSPTPSRSIDTNGSAGKIPFDV